ncbi:dap-3, partial [Pristionchus pacificus]
STDMRSRVIRLVRSLPSTVRDYSSCQSSFPTFKKEDVGKLYEISKEHFQQLNLSKNLPSTMRKQCETLSECVSLVREPLVEVISWMDSSSVDHPSVRLCLWGPFGTGKTITLNQTTNSGIEKGWAIVHHRSGLFIISINKRERESSLLYAAMDLTRQVQEVEMSTFVSGRINDPVNAAIILNEFKTSNSHLWSKLGELKTHRSYEWTKKEKTDQGKSLTEIVEMGLSAPFLSSDCVGGLFRELRLHASEGNIKLLVAIDDANSLWGKTLVKRADRTYANASDLTLVQHYRRLLNDDWSNGTVVLVADKKEISDARDKITVPRHTPMECFGVDGLMDIEPFVPIETGLYSDDEIKSLHEYYVQKNWLSSNKAQSEAGLLEMKHVSAFNPYYFERICAFV